MANFDSSPYEIQRLILQYIDSTKQLGECRRVCKKWDSPAECAMFSRKLYITEHNSTSLYMHLSRKPSRANLIKEIYLGTDHFTDTMALLLQLAATSSLREIASDGYPDIRFYQTLSRIAKDSRMKLQHLKSIPLPAAYSFTETYCQTILLLKDSLEEIKIPPSTNDWPHEISKHLDEFNCLSTLHVDCVFQNLPQAESIFRGARKLKEIDLTDCYINHDNGWSSEESLHWMKQNVEISETAMTLIAIDYSNLSISLIEYFLYKYPNMRQFDYYIGWADNDMVPEVEINTQACLWISKIPRYTLNLAREHQWKSHYRLFAGYKSTCELYYEAEPSEVQEPITITSKIEQDQKRNTQFEFGVDNIFEEELFGAHVTFLEEIGAFTTSVYMNFEQPAIYDIGHRHTFESRALFQALKVMNHLDDMQFISPDRLEAVELDLSSQHQKRRLKTLEITGTEIQPAAFHTLDRLFYTINTLKLSHCYIKKDKTNTVCIHMPSTALEKLSITELEPLELTPSFEFLDYQSDNQGKMLLSHDTFLIFNLQQGVTLYFKLEPFNSNVQQIPFVDYVGRPRDSTAFSIYTRLIASIELDLGDICAKIDVQKYCKALDAAFDELRLND